MAAPLLGMLVKPISELVGKVLDKIGVDKNKKLEAMVILKNGLINFLTLKSVLFEQRVMKEYDNPNWFRDAVRPIITYTAWAVYIWVKGITIVVATKIYYPMLMKLTSGEPEVVYARATEVKSLLTEYLSTIFTKFDVYLLGIILTFWFGGKVLERVQRSGLFTIPKHEGWFSKLLGKFNKKKNEEPEEEQEEDMDKYLE